MGFEDELFLKNYLYLIQRDYPKDTLSPSDLRCAFGAHRTPNRSDICITPTDICTLYRL